MAQKTGFLQEFYIRKDTKQFHNFPRFSLSPPPLPPKIFQQAPAENSSSSVNFRSPHVNFLVNFTRSLCLLREGIKIPPSYSFPNFELSALAGSGGFVICSLASHSRDFVLLMWT